MAKKHSIVAGLDIGTSKVCAVIGEMTDQQPAPNEKLLLRVYRSGEFGYIVLP